MGNKRDSWSFAKNAKRLDELVAEQNVENSRELKRRQDIKNDIERPAKTMRMRQGGGYMNLYLYSRFSSMRGASTVLKHGDTGWYDLKYAHLLKCWSTRIRHAIIDEEKCWDNSPFNMSMNDSNETHVLLEAIALGDDTFAHGYGRKLIRNFETTKGGDKVYFYITPTFPFAFKLYCQWVGYEAIFRDDIADPLGPYQALFDTWNSPAEFTVALQAAIDFHCVDSREQGKVQVWAFNPYNIFPVEILAILRIRREQGLETTLPDHPLVQSLLMTPPAVLPEVHDELLDRVIEFARIDFPKLSLSDPW